MGIKAVDREGVVDRLSRFHAQACDDLWTLQGEVCSGKVDIVGGEGELAVLLVGCDDEGGIHPPLAVFKRSLCRLEAHPPILVEAKAQVVEGAVQAACRDERPTRITGERRTRDAMVHMEGEGRIREADIAFRQGERK